MLRAKIRQRTQYLRREDERKRSVEWTNDPVSSPLHLQDAAKASRSVSWIIAKFQISSHMYPILDQDTSAWRDVVARGECPGRETGGECKLNSYDQRSHFNLTSLRYE